jgi:hypothetical protein
MIALIRVVFAVVLCLCPMLRTALATEGTVPSIELPQAVYFASSTGESLSVDAGSYQLTLESPSSIKLTAVDQSQTRILPATKIVHEEQLEMPAALLAQVSEDDQRLVFLLPDGTGWEASGSLTGVRARGTVLTPLTANQIRNFTVARPSVPSQLGRPIPSPPGPPQRGLSPVMQMEIARIKAQSQRIKLANLPSPITLKIEGRGPEPPPLVDTLGKNWKEQPKTVRFRWQTIQAGVVSAMYQVSLFPFTKTLDNWALPPGLVTCGPAPAAVGHPIGPNIDNTFVLDLNTFAPLPGMKATYKFPSQVLPQKLPPPSVPIPMPGPGPIPQSTPLPQNPIAPRGLALPVASMVAPPAAPNFVCGMITQETQKVRHNLVANNPLTYYVRVLTVNAQGQLTAPPSKVVTIIYHMEDPPQIKILTSPLIVSIKQYVPIHWALNDYQYHYVCTKVFPLFCSENDVKAKKKLEFYPSSGCSGLDCIGEAIGNVFDSFVSLVEDAVNWVSQAYQDIKEAALNLAMKFIPFKCDPCRTALKMGLDYGLVAMGMPPDIPDFDRLVAMGKDYLKGQLVEAVTQAAQQTGVPVPPEATEALLNEVIKKAQQTANNGPDGSQWFKPDPDFQYRDPYVLIRVDNPSNDFRRSRLWIPQNDLYETMDIMLPLLPPNTGIDVPVVLKRRAQNGHVDKMGHVVGKPGDYSYNIGFPWMTKYYSGNQVLQVSLIDVGVTQQPTANNYTKIPLPGCAQLKANNPAEPC